MKFVKPTVLLVAMVAFGGTQVVSAAHAPVWGPLSDERLVNAPATLAGADGSSPGSLSLPLHNYQGLLYYFEMQVGMPPQTVRVGLDTTMANIGITSIKGGTHKYYNHSRSSTYKPDGRAAKFRDGMSGVVVQDRLALRDAVAAKDKRFVEITDVSSYGRAYPYYPMDGWFGIGQSPWTFGGLPTFVRSLAKLGVINKACVGISTPRGKTGKIVFGLAQLGRDHSVVSTAAHPDLWGYDVLDIKVGNTSIPTGKTIGSSTHGFAALDIQAPYIIGHVDAVTEIAKLVNATLLDYGVFAVPCDAQLPDVSFISRGGSDTLTTSELVGRRVNKTLCEFNIVAHRDPTTHEVADWAMGAPLFHRYSFLFYWPDTHSATPVLTKGAPRLSNAS